MGWEVCVCANITHTNLHWLTVGLFLNIYTDFRGISQVIGINLATGIIVYYKSILWTDC